MSLAVHQYAGNNSFVLQMAEICRPIISGGLADVLIQGSLGTQEEVRYSDFDAVAVLRQDSFRSADTLYEVVSLLRQSRSIMYSMDPLQHHGWFTIPFFVWHQYHESYLPLAALEHAAALGRPFSTQLSICTEDRLRERLVAFCQAIRSEVESRRYLQSWYACKSFLSKLLLLPAMYVQVRDNRGVFKAHSFASAKPDFSPEAWLAIEVATKLRTDWCPPRTGWRRLKRRPDIIGMVARRRLSGRLPKELKQTMGGEMEHSVTQLLHEIEGRLPEDQCHHDVR